MKFICTHIHTHTHPHILTHTHTRLTYVGNNRNRVKNLELSKLETNFINFHFLITVQTIYI